MSRGKQCTYAIVYNDFYKMHTRKKRVVRRHVQTLLDSQTALQLRIRRMHCLVTIRNTQSIGKTLFDETIQDMFQNAKRLLHIAKMIQIRKIQRRISQHVWRPGGVLSQNSSCILGTCDHAPYECLLMLALQNTLNGHDLLTAVRRSKILAADPNVFAKHVVRITCFMYSVAGASSNMVYPMAGAASLVYV